MVDTGRRMGERWLEKIRLHGTSISTATTEISSEGDADEDLRMAELALMVDVDVLGKKFINS